MSLEQSKTPRTTQIAEDTLHESIQTRYHKMWLNALTLELELKQAREELAEWKKHAAESDHEFLEMSDWLIGNAMFDPKTGLIDHSKKLKERIRDLIALEGQIGDLQHRLAEFERVSRELQQAIRTPK